MIMQSPSLKVTPPVANLGCQRGFGSSCTSSGAPPICVIRSGFGPLRWPGFEKGSLMQLVFSRSTFRNQTAEIAFDHGSSGLTLLVLRRPAPGLNQTLSTPGLGYRNASNHMPVLEGKCPGIVAADRKLPIINNKLSMVRIRPWPSIVLVSLGFRSLLLESHHPSDWTRPDATNGGAGSSRREVPAAVEMRCSCQIVEPRLQLGKPQSSPRVVLLEKTVHELTSSNPSPHLSRRPFRNFSTPPAAAPDLLPRSHSFMNEDQRPLKAPPHGGHTGLAPGTSSETRRRGGGCVCVRCRRADGRAGAHNLPPSHQPKEPASAPAAICAAMAIFLRGRCLPSSPSASC
ncbi:hypothetical protein IWX47DRAFT_565461 [Phyllosticta citricarpa]